MKNKQASNGSLINYTYDLVGNVTQVASTCPWLPNQSFIENFNYDSADQLTAAQENQNNGYQLTVNYGHWGKVNNYDLAQTDFINNTSTGDSRLFTYPSDPNNLQVAQTMFAPEQCNGTADILFSFGINGSLRKREVTQPQQHTEYYLFNSQGNLKAYSDDIMSFAYYGYNAANTRAYKISLYNTNLWINGQQQPLNLQLQNAMFYPNTYLNFNQNGEYTKHYYNGMERIASRLGDNTTTIAINNNILEDRKLLLEDQFKEDIHKLIYETVPIDMPPFIDVNTLQPTGTPNDIYYYHPNHLGSTSFVTDQNQTITQGFLYAPFGEITTEYNVNFGNNTIPKYSFNAKELDEETGMYYYEARYYAPPTFTSRDPMFEKYFWMSPYAYCANNPVKYVDPSGEETWEPDKYGNLIAEDGDNAEELSKCMGISFEKASELLVAQGYSTENVPKGSVLKLDNAFTRDLAKHGDIPTQDYRDENSPLYYNCWGSAITGTQNRIITAGKNGCGIDFPVEFDNDLLTDYENVDFSKSILGKTIIRFEDTHPYENSNFNNICEIGYVSRTPGEVGSASHGAVYYGTSRNGTVYVYSKNGWGAPPVICPLNELFKSYGSVRGINGQTGYYNPVN